MYTGASKHAHSHTLSHTHTHTPAASLRCWALTQQPSVANVLLSTFPTIPTQIKQSHSSWIPSTGLWLSFAGLCPTFKVGIHLSPPRLMWADFVVFQVQSSLIFKFRYLSNKYTHISHNSCKALIIYYIQGSRSESHKTPVGWESTLYFID